MVRPWNERSKTTYSKRPCALPDASARTSSAPSHASVPELQKKTFEGKARATRRSASAVVGSVWNRLLVWMSLPACSRMALTHRAVAVAEAVHRDPGREVEVGAAFLVEEPRTLAARRG